MVKFSFNKRIVEGVVLLLLTLLYLGAAPLLQQRIIHEFPHGYYASDAFWQLTYATHVYNVGSDKYRPFYDSAGYEDVIGVLPPMAYQLSAAFAHLSGIPIYDALIFLIILIFSFASMVMYLIIRKLNRNVALLSLPFMLLVFSKSNFAAITWGKHLVIMGGFFLLATFWALTEEDLDKQYLLLGLFLGATLLSHPPEFIFAVVFMVGLIAWRFLRKQPQLKKVKNDALAVVIGLILSGYYVIIFYFTLWKTAQPGLTLFHPIVKASWPLLYPRDFGILGGAILLIGLVLALFYLWKEKGKIVAISIYMLALGLSNYIGLQERSFQQRYFWPFYLSLFFGLALFHAINQIPLIKKHLFTVSIVLILLSSPFIIAGYYQKQEYPGLMDPYHWEAFKYLKENTSRNAKILYIYGDSYGQIPILMMTERRAFLMDTTSLVEDIKNNQIRAIHSIREVLNADAKLAYRTGLFSFRKRMIDNNIVEVTNRSFCDFPYVVLDRISRTPQLAQYNLQVREIMLKHKQINEVFTNGVVSILHNKRPGEDCLGST